MQFAKSLLLKNGKRKGILLRRCKSYGLRRRVVGRVFPDVSEIGTSFIVRVKRILLDPEHEDCRVFEKSRTVCISTRFDVQELNIVRKSTKYCEEEQ